ncbi:ab-hydrolase associated lipase region [Apiospora arundinis]
MPVPFIGRLNPAEYIALVGSFVLVGLEAIIRILTLALPISTSIRNASDFVDLCAEFGYTAEEHVVQTKDGYLLGIHRLPWRRGEEDMKVNNGPLSLRKKVVYLHHGLLMNSEVWVSLTDAQRCLPFVLVERGYDVWLGNNRGNKYSKKSVKMSPASIDFWDFSIDEFAFYDIPDTIEYVLHSTGQSSLSYIGFSQGTAQSFAALSVHPKLNDQVNVFIALAPAMSPAGLSNGIVDALVKAFPPSALSAVWSSVDPCLGDHVAVHSLSANFCLSFLFNWKAKNISLSQKLAAYPHLYSFTSTKSVVHWFQIIRNKSFQMFDDDVHPPLSTTHKYTKVAKYPTRNIKTPIVLVYGGSDSLVDIKVMLRELPNRTVATEIPHYEHLDFLWARDVDTQVFQHVFDALDNFTDAEHSKEEFESYRRARATSLGASASFKHAYRNSDAVESDIMSVNSQDPAMEVAHKAREDLVDDSSPPSTSGPSEATDATDAGQPETPNAKPQPHAITTISENAASPASPVSTPTKNWGGVDGAGSPISAQERKTPSPIGGKGPRAHKRRGSGASNLSFDAAKDGKGRGGGIRIGTSKPVVGASVGSATGGSTEDSVRKRNGV